MPMATTSKQQNFRKETSTPDHLAKRKTDIASNLQFITRDLKKNDKQESNKSSFLYSDYKSQVTFGDEKRTCINIDKICSVNFKNYSKLFHEKKSPFLSSTEQNPDFLDYLVSALRGDKNLDAKISEAIKKSNANPTKVQQFVKILDTEHTNFYKDSKFLNHTVP
jgi:hypothetical protein